MKMQNAERELLNYIHYLLSMLEHRPDMKTLRRNLKNDINIADATSMIYNEETDY